MDEQDRLLHLINNSIEHLQNESEDYFWRLIRQQNPQVPAEGSYSFSSETVVNVLRSGMIAGLLIARRYANNLDADDEDLPTSIG